MNKTRILFELGIHFQNLIQRLDRTISENISLMQYAEDLDLIELNVNQVLDGLVEEINKYG